MIELFIDGGELFNLAAQTLHLLTLVVTTAVTYQQLLTQRNPAAQESLGIEPELVKGDNGIFDVRAEGKLVFSKHRDGRYPEPAEIIGSLRELPPA